MRFDFRRWKIAALEVCKWWREVWICCVKQPSFSILSNVINGEFSAAIGFVVCMGMHSYDLLCLPRSYSLVLSGSELFVSSRFAGPRMGVQFF